MPKRGRKHGPKSGADRWFVYLLRCADRSLYTGIAKDVCRRCRQHNAGTASRYTRSRLPVEVVYEEVQRSRSAALKREAAIKALPKRDKEALVLETKGLLVRSKSNAKRSMGLRVHHSITDVQVLDLMRLYQSEWWTRGRQEADVQQMLQHCDLIVAICAEPSERLVGFARVLTDFVYKALIFDVIVDASFRSQGLGRTLMDGIVNHPALSAVRHLELYCQPEMAPFYERWGFSADLGKLGLMRLTR
jgi:predicted GIY-YIG superfamily endonuclease/GNAT superfamily N-acetyltransferase